MKFLYIFIVIGLISCEKETKVAQTETTSIKHQAEINQEETHPKITAPKGNQLFKESVKLRYLQGVNGYILTSVKVKPCENSGGGVENPDDDKNLTEITFDKDTFTVDFSIVDNCCSEFLCEAEMIDESTLNIIYHPFGRHCSCYCKFEMQYTFTFDDSLEEIGQKRTVIKYIQFNNDSTSKVEFKK